MDQDLINQCYKWAIESKMLLNATKTKAMHLSLRKKIEADNTYVVGTTTVETVQATRLLGVHIDQHLSFQEHVAYITESANRKAHGLLALKQSGLSTEGLLQLYMTAYSLLSPILVQPGIFSLTNNSATSLRNAKS